MPSTASKRGRCAASATTRPTDDHHASVAGQPAKAARELAERDVAGPGSVTGPPLARLPHVEQQRAGPHETIRLPRADSLAPTEHPPQPAHGHLRFVALIQRPDTHRSTLFRS